MDKETIKKYQLSGGGMVTVLQPFGSDKYAAVVEMSGVYPDPGKIARNAGRDELIMVLDGSFEIEVNSVQKTVCRGETITIPDQAEYRITGTGRSLVIVYDRPGGATEIINQK